MRILVYGAGVQGSLYAARLAEDGHEVAVLARGRRLAELRASGVVLQDIDTGRRTATAVPLVERLAPADAYDVVLVPVRREQIDSVLPALHAAVRVPAVVFMHNHAAGSASLAAAVGAERVLLGFPGAGGTRAEDGAVHFGIIRQQPTTLGEYDGQTTPRLRALADALRSAGFPVALSGHMDAWLTAHAIFVTAISGALYRVGGDPARLAASAVEVGQFTRAVREGFRAFRRSGRAAPPLNLRAVFEWAPSRVAVWYWRRYFARPAADYYVGHHARGAATEMRALVADLRAVLPVTTPIPALHALWAAVDAYADAHAAYKPVTHHPPLTAMTCAAIGWRRRTPAAA